VKILISWLSLSLLAVAVEAQESPPPGLAEVENARSRECVPALARLADLNRALEPFGRRADRLRVINRAIALEDTAVAAPFDMSDAAERAAHDWFLADAELARQFVDTRAEMIQEQRAAAKDLIRGRLVAEMDSLRAGADAHMVDAGEIETAAQPCDGAVFVRPVVLEACVGRNGPLCDAARVTGPSGAIRFVDAAEDLWDLEELRPWSEVGPLRAGADGSILGARTASRARLGNVVVTVGLGTIIRDRESLPEAEVAAFDANLDTLGIDFAHPKLVMAPAIELQASVPAPIGGETHYLLHFGDLTGDDDVVWSAAAGASGLLRASFPAKGQDLQRLAEGSPISFTAVKLPEDAEGAESATAEAVYSLTITAVNQVPQVTALLSYIVGGGLSRDLAMLVPPTG
jgi:hypothetical protein